MSDQTNTCLHESWNITLLNSCIGFSEDWRLLAPIKQMKFQGTHLRHNKSVQKCFTETGFIATDWPQNSVVISRGSGAVAHGSCSDTISSCPSDLLPLSSVTTACPSGLLGGCLLCHHQCQTQQWTRALELLSLFSWILSLSSAAVRLIGVHGRWPPCTAGCRRP